MRQVAEANNAFGVALYREFARQEKGNLVFSPFSLLSGLALTATGARGQTEAELWQALRLGLPREQVAVGYAGILASFARAARGELASVTVANSLWTQQGYALKPEFLGLAHGPFAAEVTPLDYTQPAAAAGRINDWIRARTAGLIPQLVEPAMFDEKTRLTLCNAVHFRAAWLHEFEPEATRPARFTLADRTTVEVPTMRQEEWFHIAEAKECRLLCLPYAVGFEMVIVLPWKTDGLARVEGTLGGAVLVGWYEAMASAKEQCLALELPKFKTATMPGCMTALGRLGVQAAFSQTSADFSGMADSDWLSVGNVLQKAVIELDEKGTVAAAASAVELVCWGIRATKLPTPIPFRVDHPFLFFIREIRTGTILFMGRIEDPRVEGGAVARLPRGADS